MIEELKKNDKNFSEGLFKSYADNVFIKLFTAIMIDELDGVKHFLSEELYNKYKNIINELKNKNLTQMYDELNIRTSEITNINITDTEYIITFKIDARYMDYLINSDTGNYVKGNNKSRIEKNYILTFKKIIDYKNQNSIRRCPGCGASIDVNDNGKCVYCSTTYNLDDYDYILYNINEE